MEFESIASAVVEETPECVIDRAECDLIPGNLGFGHQRGFEGLLTWLKIKVQQFGAVDDVNLADVGDVHEAEHRAQGDPGAGFFEGLTKRGFAAGLAVLHEAGRERPLAIARFDGPLAHQDPVFPGGDCADNDLGVLVVDCPALVADMAGKIVAGGNFEADRGATVGAEVHGRRVRVDSSAILIQGVAIAACAAVHLAHIQE